MKRILSCSSSWYCCYGSSSSLESLHSKLFSLLACSQPSQFLTCMSNMKRSLRSYGHWHGKLLVHTGNSLSADYQTNFKAGWSTSSCYIASPISARHGKRLKLLWSPGCIGSFFPFDFLPYMLSYVLHILQMSKVI